MTMFVSPLQEAGITATSWDTCSSCSVWSAGWCTAASPVSSFIYSIIYLFFFTTVHFSLSILPLTSLLPSFSPRRLENPLRHQLRQGWFLALPDPDRLLLPLDVLDVPQQRLPLHVGGRAHHVSALPGLPLLFNPSVLKTLNQSIQEAQYLEVGCIAEILAACFNTTSCMSVSWLLCFDVW